jgi:superfamily II RNA helicase
MRLDLLPSKGNCGKEFFFVRIPHSAIRNRGFGNHSKIVPVVLNHFSYLNFREEKVSEVAVAADLRVDRPLLVGEAMRNGLFDGHSSKDDGRVDGFACRRFRSRLRSALPKRSADECDLGFRGMSFTMSRKSSEKFGIEPAEEINLSAAAAAERWAGGMSWADLARRTKAEEGDLVRLLSRTGEALMQIAYLKASNPKASSLAYQTAELILREPVR